MKSKNLDIEESLFNQLKQKGIEQNQLPLFIKDLNNTLSVTNSLDLTEVNNRLYVLGWTDFEMDYHTFQLAKACIENWKE